MSDKKRGKMVLKKSKLYLTLVKKKKCNLKVHTFSHKLNKVLENFFFFSPPM